MKLVLLYMWMFQTPLHKCNFASELHKIQNPPKKPEPAYNDQNVLHSMRYQII
jgi:hypothetical protein